MLNNSTYKYDQVKLDCLEKTISPERLRTYIVHTGGDKGKALELYLWNIALSESLYLPLQVLEVSLRNALNQELCAKYGIEWYKNKPIIFGEDQANRLAETIKNFDKSRPTTVSDIVARVSFGFWVDILYFEMYEELWRKCIYKAFPYRAKGTKRNTIAPIIKRLKDLRNRVAHHEPIWSRSLVKDYNEIIEILRWICPATSEWVNHHSRFLSVWNNRPNK